MEPSGHFKFPRWTNLLLPMIGVMALGVPVYLQALVGYGAAPRTTAVGYQPIQPIPFSHAMHAGELGMDCRYCHTTVETSGFAALPPSTTCMNCHVSIHKDSEQLQALRDSFATGQPIPWVKVHDLPDYVYFNHAAHVSKGVSCVDCHDRVDHMETVYQAKDLAMGWCLDCHRNASDSIRPKGQVTNLEWTIASATVAEIKEIRQLKKSLKSARQLTDCSTCHR